MRKVDSGQYTVGKVAKVLVIIGLVFIGLVYLTSSAKAQEETSASAKQASASSSLIEKINAIKQDVASKAAQYKEIVVKKLQNKALAGSILVVDDHSLTIKTLTENRVIAINEYTKFLNKSKTKVKSKFDIKNILVNDFVVALGDVDDKGVLTAKQLIKQDPIASDSAQLIWGKIESSDRSSIEIKKMDGEKLTINPSSQTVFFLGNEEASILDAKEGKALVVKGAVSEGKVKAKFIFFIPSPNFIKPEKKVASSSASQSASPKK